jgi:hypothetical protein
MLLRKPEGRRSDGQRNEVSRFKEFGCTFCHKVGPDKVGLTDIGARLTHMHLGCVDIEKQLAKGYQPTP